MHQPHTHGQQLEVMTTDPLESFIARRRHAVDRVRQWRRARARSRWGWLIDLLTPRSEPRSH